MNLPNTITFSRLILTGVFVAAATRDGVGAAWIALISFVIAAVSDFVDGWLARRMGLVTPLGKLLDPLADKVLVSAAFVFLTQKGFAPVWVTVLIIAREFMVTGLRQIAVEAGHVMAADRLGKWKTTLQLTFCISCLLWMLVQKLDGDFLGLVRFFRSLCHPDAWLMPASMWGALALTLISGGNYFWSCRHLLFAASSK